MRTLLTIVCCAAFLVQAAAFGQDESIGMRNEAQRQMNAGRYGEAITILNQYLTKDPKAAEGYHLRGLCYLNRSELENAVNDLRRAAALSSSKEIRKDLTRAETALKATVGDKIEGYKREIARNQAAPVPYREIAKAYETLKDWKESQRWYEQYFARTDGTPEEVLHYSEILARTNNLARGEEVLRKLSDQHRNRPEILSRYGYFLLWQGKYQLSRKIFEEALALKPGWKEAEAGLADLKTHEEMARRAEAAAQEARRQESPEGPVDRFQRLLRSKPSDDQTRLQLVYALAAAHRFDEAERQIDTLATLYVDSTRITGLRAQILTERDSVLRQSIRGYLEILKDNPENGEAVRRIAGAYSQLGEYEKAVQVLEAYLVRVPDSSNADLRFRYAQYAAWNKQYDRALGTLTGLLDRWPGNLDYQLLRGQLAVWTGRDIDLGARYIANVLRNKPTDGYAMIAMSSLLALKRDFAAAQEYLRKARGSQASPKDIRAAEAFYREALEADAERKTFNLLTEARDLVAAGNCAGAIGKYDEYFARVIEAPPQVLSEYADAYTCTKRLPKAIEVYDQILQKHYDHRIAVQRAKNILWSGDSLRALAEFTKLREEQPNDFASSFYLAEAFSRLQNYERARQILQDLADHTTDEEQQDMVDAQLKRLPPTGISRFLSTLPTRAAVAPPFAYYTDNQDFQLMNYGGRVEVGVAPFLTLSGAFLRTRLRSSQSTRTLSVAKGQLYLQLSERLMLSGGAGKVATLGEKGRVIGDASISYKNPDRFSFAATFERTDAALVLYSPYLIDLRYDATLLSLSGSLKTRSGVLLGGMLKAITVSDGNIGTDLQLRVGKAFIDDVMFGYEYRHIGYQDQALFIPFTNHSRQLYYSPDNLESHSVWMDWPLEKGSSGQLNIEGKAGYIPAYRAFVRELSASGDMRVYSGLAVTGKLSFGSTVRFESQYSYSSAQLSVYWGL